MKIGKPDSQSEDTGGGAKVTIKRWIYMPTYGDAQTITTIVLEKGRSKRSPARCRADKRSDAGRSRIGEQARIIPARVRVWAIAAVQSIARPDLLKLVTLILSCSTVKQSTLRRF